jgi:very-short-patch-repair endonuclease
MDDNLKYNSSLKPLVRELRKEGTKGEALLWKKVLRAKSLEGYQFNRQFPLGDFIVDFICRKLKMIIEIDGSSHLTKGMADRKRQDDLEKAGFTILRFSENEVVYRTDDVIKDI